MSAKQHERPWQELEKLLEREEISGIELFFDQMAPDDKARAISRLDQDDQMALFSLLTPEFAAELLEEISEPQALELIEDLPHDKAASIINEIHSDLQADMLGALPHEDAQHILALMEDEEAEDARRLMEYEPDQAGGMMITEFLAYEESMLARDVISDLQQHGETYADYDIQYVYILSNIGRLAGVLRLRDLLFSGHETQLRELMIKDPLSVSDKTSLDGMFQFFQDHSLVGAPVVDEAGRLVGVIRRNSVLKARNQNANQMFLRFSGIIGGEEFRNMPLGSRSLRRLSWLSVNILLNLISVSVIAYFEDTLQQVIALAFFLPMISDMSGCSGNQAVAVSMRELSLGLVKPHEIFHVIWKEARLGLINGLALGGILTLVAGLWKGNYYLGIVVGGALAVNTIVAVVVGGILPLLSRRLGVDPALVSGPLLTTCTDMFGFFMAFLFATLLLGYLVG